MENDLHHTIFIAVMFLIAFAFFAFFSINAAIRGGNIEAFLLGAIAVAVACIGIKFTINNVKMLKDNKKTR